MTLVGGWSTEQHNTRQRKARHDSTARQHAEYSTTRQLRKSENLRYEKRLRWMMRTLGSFQNANFLKAQRCCLHSLQYLHTSSRTGHQQKARTSFASSDLCAMLGVETCVRGAEIHKNDGSEWKCARGAEVSSSGTHQGSSSLSCSSSPNIAMHCSKASPPSLAASVPPNEDQPTEHSTAQQETRLDTKGPLRMHTEEKRTLAAFTQ
jgi:hypothetical protein